MGKKTTKNRNKKNPGHKAFRKSIRVKNRAKDLDQIQDEMKREQQSLVSQADENPTETPTIARAIDIDLPGAGQFYCVSCG